MAIRFQQWGEEFQRGLCRERIVRDRIDPFHQYDDVDLYTRFQFCRAELLRITGILDNDLQHNTKFGSKSSDASVFGSDIFCLWAYQNLVGDSVHV